MSLLSVIADNSSAIYAVCIPGLLIAGGYVAWKTLFAEAPVKAAPPKPQSLTPRRPMAPVPTTKPKSLAVGQNEHQSRGEAKTVKVPAAPSVTPAAPAVKVSAINDDEAKDSLFAGLGVATAPDETPAQKEESTILRKAERMEELGFHLQARSQPIPGRATDSDDQNKTELLKVVPSSSAVETQTIPSPAAAAPAPAAPSAPRTQTQELDDILSRIDKVLADNPVMAEMTLGSDSNAAPKQPTTEVTKKKTDSDVPGQQKLF